MRHRYHRKYKVCVTLKNIGRKIGKEIVQLYISAPTTEIDKPLYELKAFAKTTLLKPQESQIVSFLLSAKDLASFQSGISSWVADKGEYILSIGASVKDIHAKKYLFISLPAFWSKKSMMFYIPISQLRI
ncbi:MAG: fibronectin type III-like domain-contianing protein [Bacteroides cellulosilyticus]